MSEPGAERTPLYRHLVEHLRTAIVTGALAPGDQLPSEPELAETHGVSRSVVRQTLSLLASDGLVHKSRGRRSIVAARPRYQRYVTRSSGLYHQFRDQGIPLSTRVRRFEETALPPSPAAFFGARRGIVLDRVRGVDGQVVGFVRTYLPLEACRELLGSDLNDRSLHEALATTLGLRVTSGRRTIEAVPAPIEVADDLEVAAGDPLLLLRSEGCDQHDRPLEWFQTWHRADRIAFEIQVLTNDADQMVEELRVATPPTHVPAALAPTDSPGEGAWPTALADVPRVVVAATADRLAALAPTGVPIALAAPSGPPTGSELEQGIVWVHDPADVTAWAGRAITATTSAPPPAVEVAAVGTAAELDAARAHTQVVVVDPAWQHGPEWVRWIRSRAPEVSVIAWDVPPDDIDSYLDAGARLVAVASNDTDAVMRALRPGAPAEPT